MATIVPRRRTEIAPMKRGPFFFVWAWDLSKVCEREGEWEERGTRTERRTVMGGRQQQRRQLTRLFPLTNI